MYNSKTLNDVTYRKKKVKFGTSVPWNTVHTLEGCLQIAVTQLFKCLDVI